MAAGLYMDVHVQSAITRGLRLRGLDVLTTQEDETTEWPDDALLDRVAELDCIMFKDDDFLREATPSPEDPGAVRQRCLRAPAGGHDWPVRARPRIDRQDLRAGRPARAHTLPAALTPPQRATISSATGRNASWASRG